LLIASFFIFQYIIYYSEIGRDVAESQQESTTIYRVGLIQAYLDFVQEKPWLGWGATTWPKAPKMESVDNQYLFILLTHGMIALSLYCCMLLLTGLKLFHKAMTIPSKFRENQSLSVTLLSILFMLSVTFITVYMAFQVEVLTFLFLGLAQGFLDAYPTKQPYVPFDEKKKKTFLPQQGISAARAVRTGAI
jgi:O-antigen ligase